MNKLISVYIHIPFCLSKCSYCDFFSIPCTKISDDYIAAVCNELEYRYKKLPFEAKIKSVYIGGGTPSLLSSSQLFLISDKLKSYIYSFDDIEFSIEVNPDDVSEDLLQNLKKCGVNRISCGIQSMNDKSLACVNRRTDSSLNKKAIELFQKNWDRKLSLDLIAGLPYETKDTFKNGLDEIIDSNPDHISLYTLTVEEGTVLFDKIENNEIDYDFDFNDELWLFGKNKLESAGYKHYEVSNFAKPGFECKHNLTYWKHEDYLGIGSGGTGTLYNRDGSGLRWTNTDNIKKYIEFWTKDIKKIDERIENSKEIQIVENIDKQNSIFEFFMMGLRTVFGVNSTDFENIFKEKMPENFISLIQQWQKKNLAEIKEFENGISYSLNEKGLLFLNKFLEELF